MADLRLDFSAPTELPDALPVLALRRGVLLPGAASSYTVGRKRSLNALQAAKSGGYLLVAGQREPTADPGPSDLLQTAVVAKVIEHRTSTDNKPSTVVLQGLARVQLIGFPPNSRHLEARFRVVDESWPDTVEATGMKDALDAELDAAIEVLGGEGRVQAIRHLPPVKLVDAVASILTAPEDWFKDVLFTHDPVQRAEKVMVALVKAREAVAARQTIRERVASATRDQQREFLLRQQLKAIQEELGQGVDGDDDVQRLRDRIDASDLPDEVMAVVQRELKRLERLGNTSPERQVAVDWLEWVAELPWGVQSSVDPDLDLLEQTLDASHFGLDDVKRQVVEHLAVSKLAGTGRADVLLLLGPPGVGKTSIGQAIADATGRKLVRVALGGVRDEAELRGHRRTYIGARPGRLIEGLRRAGTQDPVILLDEIDKLTLGGWQGDPAAALLEILDPEQNHAFVDRYLEVPFDLSKALFVATANDLAGVPGPLRDRLQIIEIAGYTPEEKLVIAKRHLLKRIARNAGLNVEDVVFTDEALHVAIGAYTREAGVRELQRVLGKVYRAAAVRKARGHDDGPLHVDAGDLVTYLDRPRFQDDDREVLDRTGIVKGLAWTPVGGTVLYVEASTLPGRGQLVLTGQLGDVMKESARAALTYTLAHADQLGIAPDVMATHDLHIHVPAGGTPKDGPSAGVTMFTAIASLLSGRAVRADTAMTGEATLRGRVLPVGGIKSKVLAAHRLGIKRIILPRRNGVDLDDIPAEVRSELEIILVDAMDEVLAAALVGLPSAESAAA